MPDNCIYPSVNNIEYVICACVRISIVTTPGINVEIQFKINNIILVCMYVCLLTLSNLTLQCHLHPLQAVNCCRNSRLVVDEDGVM